MYSFYILIIPTNFVKISLAIRAHICDNFGVSNGGHNQLSLLDFMEAEAALGEVVEVRAVGLPPQVLTDDVATGGVILVEAARLASACDARGKMACGDIAAAYSADLMATKKEGDNIRPPFLFQGRRYVCVGMVPGRSAFALRLITRREFDEQGGGKTTATMAGSYHGVSVRFGGEVLVLAGPEMVFKAAGDAPVPFKDVATGDGDVKTPGLPAPGRAAMGPDDSDPDRPTGGGGKNGARADQPHAPSGGAHDILRSPADGREAAVEESSDVISGVTVYRSGMSSRSDFTGYANACVPIVVQINDLSGPTIRLLADYNERGGLLFVDTGAFNAFRKGKRINFHRVLAAYRNLLSHLSRKRLVALVMPDVIGDQAATLDLLRAHADEIRAFIAEGCDVVIPIQKGGLSLSEAYATILDLLGTDQFRVALPSNKVAVTAEEAAAFVAQCRPTAVHLLGIAKQKRFATLVAGLRQAAPGIRLSSDANFLRAMIGRNRPLSQSIDARLDDESKDVASDGDAARGLPDETEFTYDVYNTPGYLDERQARDLATLVSNDPLTQAQVIKAALSSERGAEYGSRLGDLLEQLCPEQIGDYVVRALLVGHVKKRIRRDIRAEEITRAAAPAHAGAERTSEVTGAPLLRKAG